MPRLSPELTYLAFMLIGIQLLLAYQLKQEMRKLGFRLDMFGHIVGIKREDVKNLEKKLAGDPHAKCPHNNYFDDCPTCRH